MIVQEILTAQSDFDIVMVDLCELVLLGQTTQEDTGMVAACIIDTSGNHVYGVSISVGDKWVHAERVAINRYKEKFGDIPKGTMCITTLSPCNRPMDNRYGESCEDLLEENNIRFTYCGYKDPSQGKDLSVETENPKIKELCKKFADTFLNENFHDGKVKGKSRPGRVKRSGASCNGSVSDLRAKAKKYGGERGKMYHWCANMKGGKKKNEDALDEKWSAKYKNSIDCSNPKGFSQRAHCQGRKKK